MRISDWSSDVCSSDLEADDALAEALHRLLARSSSTLVAVQLDDALGAVEQQNLPGTVDEHPNWRRRYRVAVEALAAHPGLRALAALLGPPDRANPSPRSEEHTSELQSLMRISYAVFCLTKKKKK